MQLLCLVFLFSRFMSPPRGVSLHIHLKKQTNKHLLSTHKQHKHNQTLPLLTFVDKVRRQIGSFFFSSFVKTSCSCLHHQQHHEEKLFEGSGSSSQDPGSTGIIDQAPQGGRRVEGGEKKEKKENVMRRFSTQNLNCSWTDGKRRELPVSQRERVLVQDLD